MDKTNVSVTNRSTVRPSSFHSEFPFAELAVLPAPTTSIPEMVHATSGHMVPLFDQTFRPLTSPVPPPTEEDVLTTVPTPVPFPTVTFVTRKCIPTSPCSLNQTTVHHPTSSRSTREVLHSVQVVPVHQKPSTEVPNRSLDKKTFLSTLHQHHNFYSPTSQPTIFSYFSAHAEKPEFSRGQFLTPHLTAENTRKIWGNFGLRLPSQSAADAGVKFWPRKI